MQLTYYGHSAFGLRAGDVHLLIDPWLSGNEQCPAAIEDFDDVDAVLVTHAAFDHLGDAPEIARNNGAELVCDYATHTVLRRNGFPEDDLFGYVWGAVHEGDGWRVKVLEARHISMVPEQGITAIPLAFLVHLDGERVYHLGDTSIFGDLELFGELYDPTVGLVPVGAAPGYFSELHPDEAALVVEWLDLDLAVPMHFTGGSDHPERFVDECTRRGLNDRTDVVQLEPGATLER